MRQTDTDPDQPRRGRTVALIVAAALLLVAGGVGVYELLTPPRPVDPPPSTETASATTSSTTSHQPSVPSTPGRDPQLFARLVAVALFDWDATTDTPAAVRDRLLIWADPTGYETNGLVADLGMYLPDPDTWATLRNYGTVQTLSIDGVETPSSWPGVVASASPGSPSPGTFALMPGGGQCLHDGADKACGCRKISAWVLSGSHFWLSWLPWAR